MILLADGGSTKVDWVALDEAGKESFRVRTLGLNPAVVAKDDLVSRIENMFQLIDVKDRVEEIHFYGAGCGTPKAITILEGVFKEIFNNAKIIVAEDMLAAVHAVSEDSPAVVCIIGTGSNSCYFDGVALQSNAVSLGYTIMDEASGNFFGKILLRDYFYSKMPKKIANKFKDVHNLDPDFVKANLYREINPNMYLASFAKFMFDYKEHKYIKRIIKKGFNTFFKYRVLPYKTNTDIPLYFIGSIAYYFRDILEKVALKNNLKVTDVIQKPIDNLVAYHQKKLVNRI